MTRTKHDTHERPQAWCPACRWERMSPDEQATYREERRRAARQVWQRRNPARAALRDALVASVTPGVCDRCGQRADTAAIIDYEQARIVAWRCRPCWRAARNAWRAEHAGAA